MTKSTIKKSTIKNIKKSKKSKKSKNQLNNIINLNNLFNNENSKVLKPSKTSKTSKTQNFSKQHNLNNYNKDKKLLYKIVSNMYSLDNPINYHLINYNDNETKLLVKKGLDNFKLCKSYNFDILNEDFNKIDKIHTITHLLKNEMNLSKNEREVREIEEDLTRGVNTYININYKNLPIKFSNAFCKLWEILKVFDDIVPRYNINKFQHHQKHHQHQQPHQPQKFKVFHIAEAPGNMIEGLKYFTKKKRKNINLNHYDWRANSLNPDSLKNQEIYGKGKIFKDEFKLMKNNPNKWLWGKDDTGDITNTTNIKWFRDYINNQWLKNKDDKLDLICGDGGLGTDNEPFLLHKLDLAQVIMVLACSSIGGSCIIKHFTPYIHTNQETKNATSFFIGFLYLYFITFEKVNLFKPYTSNPDSGEFYVIGTGFKGIDEQHLTNLYSILDNFKLNDGLIKENNIPESFTIQIINFLKKINKLNINTVKKYNLLLTCYKETNDKENENKKIKKNSKTRYSKEQHTTYNLSNIYKLSNKLFDCSLIFNKEFKKEVLIPRYKKWIELYHFE